MASTLTYFRPAIIRASAGTPGKSDPSNKKPVSSNWWAPLFGWSTDPDYIGNSSSTTEKGESDPGRSRSLKFAPGCFTEEKARQLRKKTVETSTYHDMMYHSAIASRLASDVSSKGYPNNN